MRHFLRCAHLDAHFLRQFCRAKSHSVSLHRSRTTEFLPGRSSYSKNLKTPLYGEYLKFLLFGNSNGYKTNPKSFLGKYAKKQAARGIPSFGLIEGTAGLLIGQSPKF